MKRYLGRAIAVTALVVGAFMAGNITTASSKTVEYVVAARAFGLACAQHFNKVGEVPNRHYRCMQQFTAKCRRGYVLAYPPNVSRVSGYQFRILYGCKKR